MPTVIGNPKTTNKVVTQTKTASPAPNKPAAKPAKPAAKPAQSNKPTNPPAINKTVTLIKTTQTLDAKFIKRLPKNATLPANTPKLAVNITINGTLTNVIAGQKLNAVLTALMTLATTDATHANAGILTALNYALPLVKPGAHGKAKTVAAALTTFKIARYIGIPNIGAPNTSIPNRTPKKLKLNTKKLKSNTAKN